MTSSIFQRRSTNALQLLRSYNWSILGQIQDLTSFSSFVHDIQLVQCRIAELPVPVHPLLSNRVRIRVASLYGLVGLPV